LKGMGRERTGVVVTIETIDEVKVTRNIRSECVVGPGGPPKSIRCKPSGWGAGLEERSRKMRVS